MCSVQSAFKVVSMFCRSVTEISEDCTAHYKVDTSSCASMCPLHDWKMMKQKKMEEVQVKRTKDIVEHFGNENENKGMIGTERKF